MKLYDYFRSSAAYRVRIALNLKGLTPERAFVHLKRGAQREEAYLALNPQGLVPALVLDGGGPALTQSIAILEYLEETHPSPALLPKEARERARVRRGRSARSTGRRAGEQADAGDGGVLQDEMTHRGPDDAGDLIFDDHRGGFGFRRLSIIDLSPEAFSALSSLGRGVLDVRISW